MLNARIYLCLLFFAIIMLPCQKARAEIMVEVVNNTSGKAFISFSYHDVISDNGLTRGWWDVAAYGSRTIRVNTDKDNFEWYIYNERGLAWGGNEKDPQSVSRHVVKEDFFVKEGWKPRGNKHMKVWFKKITAPNKKYRIVLTSDTARSDESSN